MKTAISRLKKIKLLALDVDGVLTDCRVFLDSSGEWRRFFCIRDGYGIVQLKKHGYKVAIITASKASDIKARAQDLKIDYLHDGNIDKLSELKKLIDASGMKAEEIAYMGDDLFDIPVLKNVGFAATVPEAVDDVFHAVHYTTKRSGGHGAVREVCDLILKYGALASGVSPSEISK
jgi:3-deoxy-D-manno-octulosonate 8-phosphate phosphatase (KDO 8-P phosphatase)